jgi:hypothetical protein
MMRMNAKKADFVEIIGHQRPVLIDESLDITPHQHVPDLRAILIAIERIDRSGHLHPLACRGSLCLGYMHYNDLSRPAADADRRF